MKKVQSDLRKFRFSKLNDKEFSHLRLLVGWILYALFYYLTENFIPPDNCFVLHCKIDDIVPFCEVFVVPYVTWYLLVAGSLLYFAIYDVASFRKLMWYFIILQFAATFIYIVFPNRQDLRPDVFERDNLFTRAVGILYSVDTDTNVCPSMHVGFSMALLSVWLKADETSRWWKAFVFVFIFIVCLSVMFIKQHSVIDVFAAFGLCVFVEAAVYGKYYLKKIKSRGGEAE